MKISTTFEALALCAGMCLTTSPALAKLVKPSTYGSSVVVSKVFYAGSKVSKNYAPGKYIELYNNSTDTLDVSGMYVGLVESEAKASTWTLERLTEAHEGTVALKQVFRIPANQKMDPYTSIIIANSAIDHTENGSFNLTGADFEAKDNGTTHQNQESVPAIEMVYTYNAAITYLNLVQGGAAGVVLFAEDTKIDELAKTYAYGKEKGNEFLLLPKGKVIDGVDITKTNEPDIKRLDNSIDSASISITANAGWTGEVVYRKTAYVVGGHKVLFDTNCSALDFQVSKTIEPRQYADEPSGLTPLAVTIPESGFLAINVDKPFCGPKGMVLCYVNASNNAQTTDLRYYEYPADSTLLMKGDWIAIAQPGTYELQLSASQGVMKSRSSFQGWTDEAQKALAGSLAKRRIYKFVNTPGKVGFQRDENYAGVKWNTCDFAEGEHLYITLTDAVGARIFQANGASSYDELSFIPWHGVTPADIPATGIQDFGAAKAPADGLFYDLQGRMVRSPKTGLYIRNGKKVIVK